MNSDLSLDFEDYVEVYILRTFLLLLILTDFPFLPVFSRPAFSPYPDPAVFPAPGPQSTAGPYRGGPGPASDPAAGRERSSWHRPTVPFHRVDDGVAVRPLQRRGHQQAEGDHRHRASVQVSQETRDELILALHDPGLRLFLVRYLILIHYSAEVVLIWSDSENQKRQFLKRF